VYISHRFSTVRRADRNLFLEPGVRVEAGTHAELIEVIVRYATFFRMEASAYVREPAADYVRR
jgi:ATP-binding cassette subfamily B protein